MIGYPATKNPAAKMFYGLSIVCSSSAITTGGVGLSIYGYGKLIIVSYRYSQQFFNKFKARKQNLLLTKQIRFIAIQLDLQTDPSIYYKLFT
jgi:hypothetical protein